ncbi:CRISPR-associated helicase Cas3' [Streptomyces caniferus]|uniref:CRISPR-associated helicase Cas3 n=1 Tax=Streptomyces caniferus TaxID=285557 RepID=A0ABZ1VUD0_9ACTN|nr:CRISPR-associated helicase Cas3' [Streptomyces caniferus]
MAGIPGPDDSLDLHAALGALVGKTPSHAGGTTNLLLSHMLDAAAVADVMWERYLAPSTRRRLDETAGGPGRGRGLFIWLCGMHDYGKATPVFQRRWRPGAEAVRAAGLRWHEPTAERFAWHHGRAGGYLLQRLLSAAGWPEEHIGWVWPLVAGHHGFFSVESALKPDRKARGQLEGDERWAEVRLTLVQRLSGELGLSAFPALAPAVVPTRAVQLQLSGLIVMTDWIASGPGFRGIDKLADVSFEGARQRAAAAWEKLGLQGGWGELPEPPPDAFAKRFGCEPRPSQELAMETARQMAAPGLMVIEAPLGEGKTRAALMATEILAAKFGADGVFVGMPEWSTDDPMFGRVREWVSRIDEKLADRVALLHGKRTFNKEWSALLREPREVRLAAVGECDEDERHGESASDDPHGSGDGGPVARVPAEWFFGYARGLLCPFVVGPVDQLLYATTRTKFVMLRMAGLVGKVVVLDEVHATDVYTSQFLLEGLRWFGEAGVPVVLLSATLPTPQRQALVDAYLAGALGREEFTADDLRHPQGYPSATVVWNAPDGTGHRSAVSVCDSWRTDRPVDVVLLPEAVPEGVAAPEEHRAADTAADAAVADLLDEELTHGGCALVIRDTVERAQTLCTVLRERFGDQVVLLHEQLPLGTRADRTADCLHRLAPWPTGTAAVRPQMIVVATQVAEQAFDVDVDVLVTDLAPIDVLLQRMGRLHRGDRMCRPGRLARPRVIVTGWAPGSALPGRDGIDADPLGRGAPRFPARSQALYGRHLLLRTAALVFTAAGQSGGWSLPGDIPALVAAGYGGDDEVPEAWRDDTDAARRQEEAERREHIGNASHHLLTRRGDREATTLADLHYVAVPPAKGEAGMTALVRAGDPGVEAVLVIHDGARYLTLSGSVLAEDGAVPDDDLIDEVLADTVKLPATCSSEAAVELFVPPGWGGHERLKYRRALVLGADRTASVSGRRLLYDPTLGIMDEGPVTAESSGSAVGRG